MTKPCLTIAVAKGYLLKEGLKLLNQIGCGFDLETDWDRKLFIYNADKTVRVLQVRPWDVPAYVEQGAADLGIVGKDVLEEKDDQVMSLIDLKFGHCRLVLAGPDALTPDQLAHNMVVATKYERSAERYFQSKGLSVSIVKLYGAIELGPLTGLSDVICDLTATGKTLKEHELHEIDEVFSSTAYLVANPMSMTFAYDRIVGMVDQLRNVVG